MNIYRYAATVLTQRNGVNHSVVYLINTQKIHIYINLMI